MFDYCSCSLLSLACYRVGLSVDSDLLDSFNNLPKFAFVCLHFARTLIHLLVFVTVELRYEGSNIVPIFLFPECRSSLYQKIVVKIEFLFQNYGCL